MALRRQPRDGQVNQMAVVTIEDNFRDMQFWSRPLDPTWLSRVFDEVRPDDPMAEYRARIAAHVASQS